MSEHLSTFAQLRRDAEGWPAGLIMCDRDTFISLCEVAGVAQELREVEERASRDDLSAKTRRDVDAAWSKFQTTLDLLPQVHPECTQCGGQVTSRGFGMACEDPALQWCGSDCWIAWRDATYPEGHIHG